MKSTSAAVGAVSGCSVWAVVAALMATCLVPIACLLTMFTGTTDLAAQIVGPLVCPAGSTAIIEHSPTTFTDDDGFERSAMGAEMVCVDANNEVVANPAPLPNWIWTGLLVGAALVLAGGLAVVFAAPAAVVMGRLTNRRPK